MYKIAYREFFFRPRYLWRRLWKMRSLTDLKMNLQAMRSIMFAKATSDSKPKGAVILKEATATIPTSVEAVPIPVPVPAARAVKRDPISY